MTLLDFGACREFEREFTDLYIEVRGNRGKYGEIGKSEGKWQNFGFWGNFVGFEGKIGNVVTFLEFGGILEGIWRIFGDFGENFWDFGGIFGEYFGGF